VIKHVRHNDTLYAIRDDEQRLLAMYATGRYVDRRGKHDSQPVRESIAKLTAAGLITLVDETISVTPSGRAFVSSIPA